MPFRARRPLHTWVIKLFATRCPISMIRSNRSNIFTVAAIIPHIGDGGHLHRDALALGVLVAHRVALFTSKVTCTYAITSFRTQVSTERGQDYLVKFLATCFYLSYDQAAYRFPYCPKNTGPSAPQSAVRHSHILFAPLPTNMRHPPWFVLS